MNVLFATGPLALLGLLLTAYWVWMLVDAIRVPDGQYRAGSKIVWVLVIVLTGWLGALIYQFVGRPRTGPDIATAPGE